MLNRLLKYSLVISLVISIVYILVGLILVAWPTLSLTVLLRIIGVIGLIAGLHRIVQYSAGGEAMDFFRFELSSGIFLLVSSLLLLFSAHLVVGVLPAILGIFVIVESGFGLQAALDGLRARRAFSLIHLLLGGCSLVVGFVMLLLPKESLAALTALFGFSLILNGIERLLTTLFCSRYLRKLHKNMQDVIHDDAPPRVK